MFTQRYFKAAIVATACSALVAQTGCKKKEEVKPAAAAAAPANKDEPVKVDDKAAAAPVAAPVLPDIELAAGEGIAGWVSLKSLNGTFDAVEAIGAKLGAVPPGGNLRGQALGAATANLAQAGIKDLEWLDKTRPIHFGLHDQPKPADPAAPAPAAPNPAEMAGGLFVVLPITSKDAMLAAMTTVKKDAEAEGHAAMFASPKGEKLYIDFLDKHAVLTLLDKDRYAKVSGFAKRIAAVDAPALLYMGVSIDDLAKTRKTEIEGFVKMIEAMGAQAAAKEGNPAVNAQVMGMYTKMLTTYINDMNRFELLLTGDVNNMGLEVRATAKDGTKLAKQLGAVKGRTTGSMVNLLPANSYVSFAASSDPAAAAEQMDEALVLLKETFKLDQAAFDAMSRDMKDLTKLMDGSSAMGMYPDGSAAMGMLVVGGATDGEAAVKQGKRVIGALLLHTMAMVRAENKAKGKEESPDEVAAFAAVEQSLKEGKLEPVLAKFGPLMEPAGVKMTANTTKEGDAACDTLDISYDAAKLPPADAPKIKAFVGDKTALVLCSAKNKFAFGFGPGALEKARGAVTGKIGGLIDAPAYKSALGQDGAVTMYLNPGSALAAFKALLPMPLNISGDKAVSFSCVHRAKSYSCGVNVPVDLVKAGMDAAKGPAGGMAPAGDAAAPAGGEVAPGGAVAPAPAPAPEAKPAK